MRQYVPENVVPKVNKNVYLIFNHNFFTFHVTKQTNFCKIKIKYFMNLG